MGFGEDLDSITSRNKWEYEKQSGPKTPVAKPKLRWVFVSKETGERSSNKAVAVQIDEVQFCARAFGPEMADDDMLTVPLEADKGDGKDDLVQKADQTVETSDGELTESMNNLCCQDKGTEAPSYSDNIIADGSTPKRARKASNKETVVCSCPTSGCINRHCACVKAGSKCTLACKCKNCRNVESQSQDLYNVGDQCFGKL